MPQPSPDKSSRSLAEQIYGYLAEDEDARVCQDIPESACDEQPVSFTLQLSALTLTKLGDSLVSARLVLAWMLSALGAPAFFIAMLVPLRESLALVPQLFVAQVMREHPLRKWFWVIGSLGQALALAGMVVAILLLAGTALGWVVIGLLAFFSLSRGICSVAAKDVLGKTVSKTRRGRLSGSAASTAGLMTLATAMVVMFLPPTEGDASLFAALLGMAALLWFVAALLYAGIPETPGATEGGGNAINEAVRSLGLLLRERQFAAFVWARALLTSSAFAIPYIVVLIQQQGGGNLTDLGALLLASGMAGLVSGPLWGRWSDSASHIVMAAAAAISVLVIGIALALNHWQPALLGNAFFAAALIFLAAIAHQGARIGRKTYLVDMASAQNRAQYTAVSNTVIGVVLLLGILLGWLDETAGTPAVLALLAAIGMLAVLRSLRLPNATNENYQ